MDSPSSYLRPIHLAVAAFVLGVLFTSAVVLATGSTTAEPVDRTALLVTATFVRSSLYGEMPEVTPTPEASLDEVDQAALPVDEAPPPLPLPEEPPPEPLRSCDEIRSSGTYLSDDERNFFLEDCRTLSAASASTAPATRPVAATEAERSYRVKAQSIATSYRVSFQRYSREQVMGDAAALVDYGGLAGGWANQMANFAPVPSRFAPAQDRLQVALWELAAHTRLVAAGQVPIEDAAYQEQLVRLLDAANAAIDGYVQTVGLS